MNFPSLIKVNGRNYDVIYKLSRGLSSSVRIKNGAVLFDISRFVIGKSRDQLIDKFISWAEKRLSKVSNDFIMPEYKHGGRVCTHNKIYELEFFLTRRLKSRTSLSSGLVKLFLTDSVVKDLSAHDNLIQDLVEKAIMKDQLAYLKSVIDELNQLHFKENYNICRFKRVSSRFGSCSSKRNINIAYRLLLAPREVFRYVCVHELAHLKEMNHSKRFWSLVEEAMPDYKNHEKWLRTNGFLLG
ncbi:M48 family metallopeptidase [Candidatus Peregrinibacteria bacterium]|nr:M48 family metallopeptidase [Candidatus Peregrinibacteria bacterium]